MIFPVSVRNCGARGTCPSTDEHTAGCSDTGQSATNKSCLAGGTRGPNQPGTDIKMYYCQILEGFELDRLAKSIVCLDMRALDYRSRYCWIP